MVYHNEKEPHRIAVQGMDLEVYAIHRLKMIPIESSELIASVFCVR